MGGNIVIKKTITPTWSETHFKFPNKSRVNENNLASCLNYQASVREIARHEEMSELLK